MTEQLARSKLTQEHPSDVLLKQLRDRRQIANKLRAYPKRTLKLERHRYAIKTLHEKGASLGEIQFYLKTMAKPSIAASRSTIKRFVDRINEPGGV